MVILVSDLFLVLNSTSMSDLLPSVGPLRYHTVAKRTEFCGLALLWMGGLVSMVTRLAWPWARRLRAKPVTLERERAGV